MNKLAYDFGVRLALIDAGFLKYAAFESREDIMQQRPAGSPSQAGSADTGAEQKAKLDTEKPMNTQGWVSTGDTVKEPERNSAVGLI